MHAQPHHRFVSPPRRPTDEPSQNDRPRRAGSDRTGPGARLPLVGKWTSEFNSQIGVQKYVFEFKVEGDKLTGKAAHDHSLGRGEVKLKDDDVSFVETVKYNDQEIRITYTGKLAGAEMKLTRSVGDIATYPITATRVKEPAPKPPAAK